MITILLNIRQWKILRICQHWGPTFSCGCFRMGTRRTYRQWQAWQTVRDFFRGDTKTMTQWHVEQAYGLRGWWGVRFWVTASWTGKAEAKPEIGRRHCFSTTSGGTTTFAKINGRFKRTVVYMINKSTVYSLSEDESPSRWQWGQSSLLHIKFVFNLLRKNSLSWMLNLLLSLIIFKFSSLKFCHILGNKK